MFQFTQEPSSGSQSQYLAKITGMFPLCLSIRALSVLWRHILAVIKREGLLRDIKWHTHNRVSPILYLYSTVFQHSVFYLFTLLLFAYFSSHFTSLRRPHPHFITVGICHHNTDKSHIDKHSGTIPVILSRHWIWLPDDGYCVNRDMFEQLLHFWCVINNPAIYIIYWISWKLKYLLCTRSCISSTAHSWVCCLLVCGICMLC